MTKFPHEVGPSCPWYDMAEKYGGPNINWCENTICGWFNEPANTWSNLLYLVVGIYIWKAAKKDGQKFLSLWGPCIFITGLLSFFYHSTNNLLTQFGDFFGMYFLTGFLVSLNLRRLNIISNKFINIAFWLYVIVFSGVFYGALEMGIKVQFIIVVQAAIILGLEILCFNKAIQKIDYRFLGLGLIGIIIAETFSLLDVNRIMCDPNNHIIQGHALWHVIGAIAFIPVFKFYQQFNFERA